MSGRCIESPEFHSVGDLVAFLQQFDPKMKLKMSVEGCDVTEFASVTEDNSLNIVIG